MASAVKKAQEKIFHGAGADSSTPSSEREPGLTINIPKPTTNSPMPPPKSRPDAAQQEGGEQTPEQTPYRDRLAAKLGADYIGVERYRLEQDNAKERHWKRWGPYLSDRQWVGATL